LIHRSGFEREIGLDRIVPTVDAALLGLAA